MLTPKTFQGGGCESAPSDMMGNLDSVYGSEVSPSQRTAAHLPTLRASAQSTTLALSQKGKAELKAEFNSFHPHVEALTQCDLIW